MAIFLAFPAELKLLVMERLPDIASLVAVITSDPATRELYETHPLPVLRAVTEHQHPEITKLMQQTLSAHYSSGTVGLGEKRSLVWHTSDPGVVWDDASRFPQQSFELLKDFANTAHELSELATWTEAHQHHISMHSEAGLAIHMTRDEIHSTLWRLQQYIFKADTHVVEKPPTSEYYPSGSQVNNERNERHHYHQVVNKIQRSWLEELDIIELRNLARVLSTLEGGYGKLMRHMLVPQTSSLLHTLFSGQSSTHSYTGHLGIAARAQHDALVGVRQTYQDLLLGCRQHTSKYGHLRPLDDVTYKMFASPHQDDIYAGEDYLECFRPLIGLSHDSKVRVASLVGLNPPSDLAPSTRSVVAALGEHGLLSRELDAWKHINTTANGAQEDAEVVEITAKSSEV